MHYPNRVKFLYGKAIEDEVVTFSNLNAPEDNVLERYSPNFEGEDRGLREIRSAYDIKLS